MILPRGITGFWDRGEGPHSFIDLQAFHGHCHEAARRVGGRVMSVTEPNPGGVYRNYAVAILALPTDEVMVVLNDNQPVLAFADVSATGEILLRFRDCPALAEVFGEMGMYTILGAAELDQRPAADHLRELSPKERKQIAYWKPRRVGDIIFNFWD